MRNCSALERKPFLLKGFAARADIFVPVMDSLRYLVQAFQREAMSVIHYESVVGALDKAFLGSLGIASESYDATPLRERVNRSLTDFEQDLIVRVTKVAGAQLARGLSGQLKARRPQLKPVRDADRTPPIYTRQFAAEMAARFRRSTRPISLWSLLREGSGKVPAGMR